VAVAEPQDVAAANAHMWELLEAEAAEKDRAAREDARRAKRKLKRAVAAARQRGAEGGEAAEEPEPGPGPRPCALDAARDEEPEPDAGLALGPQPRLCGSGGAAAREAPCGAEAERRQPEYRPDPDLGPGQLQAREPGAAGGAAAAAAPPGDDAAGQSEQGGGGRGAAAVVAATPEPAVQTASATDAARAGTSGLALPAAARSLGQPSCTAAALGPGQNGAAQYAGFAPAVAASERVAEAAAALHRQAAVSTDAATLHPSLVPCNRGPPSDDRAPATEPDPDPDPDSGAQAVPVSWELSAEACGVMAAAPTSAQEPGAAAAAPAPAPAPEASAGAGGSSRAAHAPAWGGAAAAASARAAAAAAAAGPWRAARAREDTPQLPGGGSGNQRAAPAPAAGQSSGKGARGAGAGAGATRAESVGRAPVEGTTLDPWGGPASLSAPAGSAPRARHTPLSPPRPLTQLEPGGGPLGGKDAQRPPAAPSQADGGRASRAEAPGPALDPERAPAAGTGRAQGGAAVHGSAASTGARPGAHQENVSRDPGEQAAALGLCADDNASSWSSEDALLCSSGSASAESAHAFLLQPPAPDRAHAPALSLLQAPAPERARSAAWGSDMSGEGSGDAAVPSRPAAAPPCRSTTWATNAGGEQVQDLQLPRLTTGAHNLGSPARKAPPRSSRGSPPPDPWGLGLSDADSLLGSAAGSGHPDLASPSVAASSWEPAALRSVSSGADLWPGPSAGQLNPAAEPFRAPRAPAASLANPPTAARAVAQRTLFNGAAGRGFGGLGPAAGLASGDSIWGGGLGLPQLHSGRPRLEGPGAAAAAAAWGLPLSGSQCGGGASQPSAGPSSYLEPNGAYPGSLAAAVQHLLEEEAGDAHKAVWSGFDVGYAADSVASLGVPFLGSSGGSGRGCFSLPPSSGSHPDSLGGGRGPQDLAGSLGSGAGLSQGPHALRAGGPGGAVEGSGSYSSSGHDHELRVELGSHAAQGGAAAHAQQTLAPGDCYGGAGSGFGVAVHPWFVAAQQAQLSGSPLHPLQAVHPLQAAQRMPHSLPFAWSSPAAVPAWAAHPSRQ
jgi:hypothetical protein